MSGVADPNYNNSDQDPRFYKSDPDPNLDVKLPNKICLLLLRGVNGRFNEYKMMVIKNFVTLSLEDDCLTVLVCLFFLSLLFLSCLSLKITNRRFRDKLVQVIDSEQKATARKLFKKSFFQIL